MITTLLVEVPTCVSRTPNAVLFQLRKMATRIAVLDFCLGLLLALCHVPSVNAQQGSINVALAANGGVASASSTYVVSGYSFPVAAVNNGDRAGLNWGNGGVWEATPRTFPSWVEIDFAGAQSIDHVIVYSVQDNYLSPVDPSNTLTFTLHGITAFDVQAWNGAAWVTLGSVSGNNLVKRSVAFTATTTSKIRVVINAVSDGRHSMVTEIEAWTSNQPPAVTLTSPANAATFNNGATVPLAATATDSDDSVSKVEFYQGGSLLSTITTGGAGNTGSSYSYNWTTAAPGAYALTAKAYDNRGATTTSAAANITVCAPTITLTSPTAGQVVAAPGSFTLTATASTPAACGTITKVELYNGATLLAAPTSAPYTYNLTGLAAGNYALKALAYDSRGQTASATVNVIVDTPPTAALATTISGTTYTAPATLVVNAPASLTLNATAADSDGTVSKVEFYNGASLLGTVSAAPYNFVWSPGTGTYSATARAYDNRNFTGDSAALTVTVCGPPTVSMTSPTAGQVIKPPGPINFTANASVLAACGSITKVEYYNGLALVATGTVAPTFAASWSNGARGNYSLTAKAYTTRGLTGASSVVNVLVDTLPTVTLTAPVNNAQLTLPGPFTLSATASAPDVGGSISKVEFLVNNAVVATKTTTPYTYGWTPAAAGPYTIAARATDNLGGATTSTAASVVVANAPTITLLTPTAGQVVAPGSVVNVSVRSTVDSAHGRSISTVGFQAKNSNGNVVWNVSMGGCAPVPCTSSAQFIPNPRGAYTITATVTDTQGAKASSAVTFAADTPPAVSIASDRSTYPTPPTASVQLTATATETSPGTIQSVTFYANGSSIGAGTPGANNTYTLTWLTNVVAQDTMTAKATDDLATSTTSAPLTISVVQSGPTTVYYHNDFEGSPLAATDAQGHVVWLETYAPYGERYLNQNTTIRNGLWYNGKPTEDSSGLSYYGGRWYNPVMGRFYSVDPQRFNDSNPLSFNRYAYANNNPYRFVDPTGETALDEKDLGAGASGPGWRFELERARAAYSDLRNNREPLTGREGAAKGPLRFSQKTASPMFQEGGRFEGMSIAQVRDALKAGVLRPNDLPVEFIARDGVRLIVNTRSALALRQAGIPESSWRLVDRTGVPENEAAITQRLNANGLTNEGSSDLRITGSGRDASTYSAP